MRIALDARVVPEHLRRERPLDLFTGQKGCSGRVVAFAIGAAEADRGHRPHVQVLVGDEERRASGERLHHDVADVVERWGVRHCFFPSSKWTVFSITLKWSGQF